ncbi:MAG: polymer-forming cytoskeletal protein [Kangiellaceae bacterium]|nr:polymer-forming cytoskeletal protein [Kangiellaceae bacterium]
MWGNKKQSNNVDTLIAEGTCITGDITFDGALFIDGQINGNISCPLESNSILSIGTHGKIEGDIEVPNVVIFGHVQGNVQVNGKVELKPGSKVTGDLRYKVIEMNAGAQVNGKMIAMGETQALEHKPEVSVVDSKASDSNDKSGEEAKAVNA